jgi:hypothetical protein
MYAIYPYDLIYFFLVRKEDSNFERKSLIMRFLSRDAKLRTRTYTRTDIVESARIRTVEILPHVPAIVTYFLAARERYWTFMAESRLSTLCGLPGPAALGPRKDARNYHC